MKLGPADGQRRRCSSVGRRYDDGINVPNHSNSRPYHGRLPRIEQTSQPDRLPRYPGLQLHLRLFYLRRGGYVLVAVRVPACVSVCKKNLAKL